MRQLSEKETQIGAKYLACLTNVERISDHSVNIAELAKEMHERKLNFSEQAKKELSICFEAMFEILELTNNAIKDNDFESIKKVEPLEEVIDELLRDVKKHHVRRVQSGSCTLELGFVFNDCLNNFERVADHCSNIAIAVLEASDSNVHAHNYLRTIKSDLSEDFRGLVTEYTNRFNLEPLKKHKK